MNDCNIKFHQGQSLFPLRKFNDYVSNELNNRKENFNINVPDDYSDGYTAGIGHKTGPKQAWCRATSLADVVFENESKARRGFSMHSPFAFERLYGLEEDTQKKFLGHSIGLDRNGNADIHRIPNEKSYHRPAPGVTGFETETMNGEGKFRRMTLKFVCHDKHQLEYITPFFLTPGVTILVEWGWEYFNSDSLVNLADDSEIFELRRSWDNWEKRRCMSNGNYDVFYSFVTKFSYTINNTGGFDCEIQLNSVGEMIYGFETARDNISESDEDRRTEDFKNHIEASFKRGARKNVKDWIGGIDNLFRNNDDSTSTIFYPLGGFNDRNDKNRVDFKNESMGDNCWMKMSTLIDEINMWSAMTYKTEYSAPQLDDGVALNRSLNPFADKLRENKRINDKRIREHKKKQEEALEEAQNTALQFNIRDSIISGHPNLKSVDQTVLLIPNPVCPCFPAFGDNTKNINEIDILIPDERISKLDDANRALKRALGGSSEGSSDKYYDESRFSDRFDAAKIIGTDGAHFPEPKFNYYAGYLGNLYVNKKAILDSFEAKRSVKDIVMNILNKISDAACNVWSFDIVDYNNNMLTIIDRNFPGLEDNRVLESQEVALGAYTFSTMDNKSNLTEFNFSADLPDSVALQTLFQKESSDDKISSKNVDGFFQKNFKNGKIKITDKFSFLGTSARTIRGDESGEEVETTTYNSFTVLSDDLYCIAEVDPGWTSWALKVRLTEGNRGLVQNAIFEDESSSNSIAYSGAVPGLKIGCDTLGISGIKFMNVFNVDNLPYPYDVETSFQVTNVKHSFTNNVWKTHIDAGVRPNVNFIR